MRRRWLWCVLALGASCSPGPVTEVVVTVQAARSIMSQSQTLSVRVVGDPYGTPRVIHENASTLWRDGSYTIALTPDGDELGGQFRVEAVALKSGTPLGYARVVTGYVAGERRYLRLTIEDACAANPSCDDNETCHLGRCASAFIDPGALGARAADAPSSEDLIDTPFANPPDASTASRDADTVDPPGKADTGRDAGGFVFPFIGKDGGFVLPPLSVADGGGLGGLEGLFPPGFFGDGGLVFPGFLGDAGLSTLGGKCYSEPIIETAEELAAGAAERLQSNAALCFSPSASSCSLLLGIIANCSIPSATTIGGFTSYTLIWAQGTATASANKASDAGFAGVNIGTIKQTASTSNSATYLVEALAPWSLQLPASLGDTRSTTATCTVSLEPTPTGNPVRSASLHVCLQ